ncbi:MAG: SpoIIE family protein phosphatase [Candidatus Poribacteria bacterium]
MFCPRCEQENDEQAQFCQGCGTSLKKLGQKSRSMETKIAVQYAGFWERFVATFIDFALILMVLIFVILLMVKFSTPEFIAIVWLVIPWIYSAVMESSSKQATLGKMALGIVVTDLEGGRISFSKATGRDFCKILSVLSLFIGFIMAGFTQKKQALHDMMMNCLVVLRESNAIMQVVQQMNSIHNLDELLKRILDESVKMMSVKRGFVMLYEDNELAVKAARDINRDIIAGDEFQFSRSVLAEVERTGEPQLITDVQADERFSRQVNITGCNMNSILCVPLTVKEQFIGLIYIDNHLVDSLFSEHDLELMMQFANQTTNAIENARLREQEAERQRLEQEMEAAREMQLSLLPQSAPQIEGFDIAGACEPATEVGGDYFTYLWMDDEKKQLGIVLMDVTGHGMKAATTTFLANGMLQSESRGGKSPGEIMKNMHQSLQGMLPKNSFVAMSFALINTYDKILTHFNAGLPTPILIRDGNFVELDIQSDVPLGCRLPAEYMGTSVSLLSEDVLLLLSDGLTEAEDAHEQMYEYIKMGPLLHSLASRPQPANAWLNAILTDVRSFTKSNEPEDDLTVVVVRIL